MQAVAAVAAIRLLVLLVREVTAAAGQEVLTPTTETPAPQTQAAALVAAGGLLLEAQQLAPLAAQA
jgi:hypothetical protein